MSFVRKDGSWVKQQRMKQIRKMLNGAGEVKLSWFIAWCEVNMGLTEKTAKKYLRPFETLGLIEIDEAADLIIERKQDTPED